MTNTKFIVGKKYRLKQDLPHDTFGKIPKGMIATFVSNTSGSCRFKLPNGKQVSIPEKSALNIWEETR